MATPSATSTWWDFAIRLALVGCVAAWAFFILRPLLILIVWGGITSIAVYPVHRRLAKPWGERPKLAAAVTVGLALVIVVVPIALLAVSLSNEIASLVAEYDAGTLTIPAPPEHLDRWPLIGHRVGPAWALAHDDLHAAVARYAPGLEALRHKAVHAASSMAWGLLEFVFSLIVMGVFLAKATSTEAAVRRLAQRVAGDTGEVLVDQARETVRSVARGVVGVAAIQAVLLGLGCWIAGVPGPALWGVAAFAVAIAQINPMLLMIPGIVYLFQTAPTWVAVSFTVWSVLVGFLDNVLKPLLLGRGVDAPMLVVFAGAIGGLLLWGVAGLFVGPVVLVVALVVARTWMLADMRAPEPERQLQLELQT